MSEPTAALGGCQPASRPHIMTMQRLAPLFPPVSAAAVSPFAPILT
ncbi:MAG: hypothetical protein R3E39_19040 [Anaerolineae bacterium]